MHTDTCNVYQVKAISASGTRASSASIRGEPEAHREWLKSWPDEDISDIAIKCKQNAILLAEGFGGKGAGGTCAGDTDTVGVPAPGANASGASNPEAGAAAAASGAVATASGAVAAPAATTDADSGTLPSSDSEEVVDNEIAGWNWQVRSTDEAVHRRRILQLWLR